MIINLNIKLKQTKGVLMDCKLIKGYSNCNCWDCEIYYGDNLEYNEFWSVSQKRWKKKKRS